MRLGPCVVFWGCLALSTSHAFNCQVQRLAFQSFRSGYRMTPSPTTKTSDGPLTTLSVSSEEGQISTKRNRRRKRKLDSAEEAVGDQQSPVETTPVVELQPRPDEGVNLQVLDVRDLVAGRAPPAKKDSAPISTAVSSTSASRTAFDLEEDDDGGEELADSSLEQLLADARTMQALESEAEKEEGFSVPKTVQNALSALITADFFLVCVFLLWFLAGVVSSYAFKDDAIQIAFNGIFQPIVQPALGLLMIGSIASAFVKNEEEQ